MFTDIFKSSDLWEAAGILGNSEWSFSSGKEARLVKKTSLDQLSSATTLPYIQRERAPEGTSHEHENALHLAT